MEVKYMDFSESKLLLSKAEIILQEIEASYTDYLARNEITEDMKLLIKDYLDKVNTALDFAAFQVFSTYCAKYIKPKDLERAEAKVYFPLRNNIKDFNNYIKKVFPGLLEDRPDIVEVFKKYQPFPLRPKWLFYLRDLAKHNKHRTFSKQVNRKDTKINYLSLPGNINFMGGGTLVTEGDTPLFEIDGAHIDLEDPPDGVSFNGTIEIDFIFLSIDQPVLKTLKRIYRSAPTVVNDLEKII
jgi:hypothetical protein